MVDELNAELAKRNCIFKYKIMPFVEHKNFRIERVPVNDEFLSNAIINCTKEFYDFLDDFFRKYGINKLSYNNTGSICWSASGWDGIGDMVKVDCVDKIGSEDKLVVGKTYYLCESSERTVNEKVISYEIYADPDKKDFVCISIGFNFRYM